LARTKKDPLLLAQMCGRLATVMDLIGMSDTKLSQHLGYANPTTLNGVRCGTVFPDAERLFKLGQMELGACASPNLHWILTGVGKAFLPAQHLKAADTEYLEALNRLAIAALTDGRNRTR
jgi:hypothetical protein